MKKKNTYWSDLGEGLKVFWGFGLTIKHFFAGAIKGRRKPMGVESDNYFEQQNGLVTNTYPHESLPIPDNGRYKLHNEIDDCIVCDKCAKVCPVDCIDIESIKSVGEIGKTSDGSTKRLYASKFDIDMAKCCYCGLCTTVCPTECLTMTKSFDYSEFEIEDMVYKFSKMTPQEVEQKQKECEEAQAAKQAAKVDAAKKAEKPAAPKPKIPGAKPVIKPKVAGAKPVMPKPVIKKKEEEGEKKEEKKALKPVMKPKITPKTKGEESSDDKPKKPALKPIIKPKKKDE